nr:uncharacterized protein LOC109169613 [Ipomoea batatas]
MIVVVAFFLLGAWASQATAHTLRHTNHVSVPRFSPYGNNAPANPKPEKKFQNGPRNSNNGGIQYTQVANPSGYSLPDANTKKFQNGPRNSNNGGIQYTQVANPSGYSLPDANTVETINNVVEKATETMAEPPPPSGTCGNYGNHRAFGGWLAVIIAVSLYHHHRL